MMNLRGRGVVVLSMALAACGGSTLETNRGTEGPPDEDVDAGSVNEGAGGEGAGDDGAGPLAEAGAVLPPPSTDPPLPACVRTVPVATSAALNAATAHAVPG